MKLIDLSENPLPPGGEAVRVGLGSGLSLRVGVWAPPAGMPCRGTVAILPGRSEFVEKYAEVVSELLARQFAVAVLDWRGQGGSSRLLRDPRRGHVGRFADYAADLDAMLLQVLVRLPPPRFAVAHSMGGTVALMRAARGGQGFHRIVLSAPMLEIGGLRWPGGARLLAAAMAGVGGGGVLIPGGSRRTPLGLPFEGNLLTSDRKRYAAFGALARAAPELTIGAPTIGWVHAAFGAMAALGAPGALDRAAVPVLAIGCGRDRVVDTATTERVVARMKLGRTIVVTGALHEIMMERDALRSQFWAAFDRFVPGSG